MGGILDAAGGAAIGMLTADWNDKRQIKQQEQLQNMQIKGQMQMGQYNREQNEAMWRNTNLKAQREEAERAGMSVGLLYGGKGAGGAIGSTQAGMVSGAEAPKGGGEIGMGMQTALNTAMTEAQIQNIKADTTKKEVEANKLEGADTELVNANIKQTLGNALQVQLENDYMGKGAYKDGVSGYEVRYQREMAEMYNKVADTEIKKLNLEQMPVQLQNEIKRVALEGQRVAIDAMNARTAAERNAITERIEGLRRNLAITMQGQDLQMQATGQETQKQQFNKQMEQKDEDQLMQWIDKVMGAAVPWYEPSTTTDTRHWSDDGETHRSGGSTTTRRRG